MSNTPSFDHDSPFTPSRPRKKRKNKSNHQTPDPQVALERTRTELVAAGEWLENCTKLVRDAVATLAIHSPKVLCLGLGSPSSSRDARAQLAFLLQVCDDLSLERSNVSMYDPAFTGEDDHLIATLDMRRLPDSENRVAAYPLSEPTIVFMPHCDLQLYENMLRENGTNERLSQLVLIANRLSEYVDSIPSHKLRGEYPCVSQIAPLLSSRPLPHCDTHPTAFNSLSVQFARPGSLTSVEADSLSRAPDLESQA